MTSVRGDFLSRLQDELAELRKEVEVIEKKCAQKFLLLNRATDDGSTDGLSTGADQEGCTRVSSCDKPSKASTERSFKSRIPRSSSITDHSSSEDLGSPAPRATKFKARGRMTFPRPVTSLTAAGRVLDCGGYPPSSTSSSSFCSRETMSVGSGEFKCCNSEVMPAAHSGTCQRRAHPHPASQIASRGSLETESLRWEHLECGSVDGSKIPRAPRPAHAPRCFSALGWTESASLATRVTSMQESSAAAGRHSPCPSYTSVGGISSRLDQEVNSTSRLPSPPVSDAHKRLKNFRLREPYAEFNIGCL